MSVFDVSLTELFVVGLVALIFIGPEKLPKMLKTAGEWVARMRRIVSDMRAQSGIDEVLRAEGIDGGIGELRSMLRGDIPLARPPRDVSEPDLGPYREAVDYDRSREYPVEGADAAGALPEDFFDEPEPALPEATSPPAAPTAA